MLQFDPFPCILFLIAFQLCPTFVATGAPKDSSQAGHVDAGNDGTQVRAGCGQLVGLSSTVAVFLGCYSSTAGDNSLSVIGMSPQANTWRAINVHFML